MPVPKLINGAIYRYSERGELLSHRGLVGVASDIKRPSAVVEYCTLSNLKEWAALGIESRICAMARELEPVQIPGIQESPYPALPASGGTPYKGHESELVDEILDAAKERGYLCCAVGQNKAKGSGTTIGYPDLSFRRKGWPCGMACLIEVKAKDGRLSPEQTDLFVKGWSRVVWNVAGALEALEEFESGTLAWSVSSSGAPVRKAKVAA